MNYRLALLTHGPDAVARDALASFLDGLTPQPTDVLVWGDGSDTGWSISKCREVCAERAVPFDYVLSSERRGFCRATRGLWQEAARTELPGSNGLKLNDHVFWLEHDFRLLRALDLNPLAAILAQHRLYGGDPVCQVALMRNAVNDHERGAGGLFESRPGEFADEGVWLSHRSFFTTNPSLMTVDFMLTENWPDGPECEGKFGIELFSKGYRAGFWGGGEPWVDHLGARTGTGY